MFKLAIGFFLAIPFLTKEIKTELEEKVPLEKINVYLCTHIFTYTQTYIHKHTHICICVHIYVHIYKLGSHLIILKTLQSTVTHTLC